MQIFLLLLFLSLLSPQKSLFAADDAIVKLSRGLVNIVSGPGEIINQLGQSWERKGYSMGTVDGIIRGGCWWGLRTAAGVYEMVTFPIPLPKNYGPVLEPEFVFDAYGTEASS